MPVGRRQCTLKSGRSGSSLLPGEEISLAEVDNDHSQDILIEREDGGQKEAIPGKGGPEKQGRTPLRGDEPMLCNLVIWGKSGGLFANESSQEQGGHDVHNSTSKGLFEIRLSGHFYQKGV